MSRAVCLHCEVRHLLALVNSNGSQNHTATKIVQSANIRQQAGVETLPSAAANKLRCACTAQCWTTHRQILHRERSSRKENTAVWHYTWTCITYRALPPAQQQRPT